LCGYWLRLGRDSGEQTEAAARQRAASRRPLRLSEYCPAFRQRLPGSAAVPRPGSTVDWALQASNDSDRRPRRHDEP